MIKNFIVLVIALMASTSLHSQWKIDKISLGFENGIKKDFNTITQNDGGYFIDNVDINTGEQIWKFAFDLRHSKREEALLDMYVSENNKLNLLNIRNAYNTNNISWGQGTFARKELDLSNGKLLKSISYNDISEKIPELYVDYLVNRLFKHGDGQFEYLRASSDYFQNTKIDRVLLNDEGCFISVDTIRMKRKYL